MEGDQQHSRTARGARPKSGAAPPAKPTTTSEAKPKHHTMPNPVEWPKDLVGAYALRMREPINWWLEFLSLYWGCTSELPMTFVQQQAKRQATGFQLPTAQAKKLGWLNPPPASATYATMISCHLETPRAPGTSMRRGKRKV